MKCTIPTIRNETGKEFVSFAFNGGEPDSIIAFHKINADDRYYGPQLVETKHFHTERGATRWALKVLSL